MFDELNAVVSSPLLPLRQNELVPWLQSSKQIGFKYLSSQKALDDAFLSSLDSSKMPSPMEENLFNVHQAPRRRPFLATRVPGQTYVIT